MGHESEDNLIEAKFQRMGARAKVTVLPSARLPLAARIWTGRGGATPAVNTVGAGLPPVRVDVRRDGRGEYFDVRRRGDVAVEVVDVRPDDRHLLLLAREPAATLRDDPRKSKFLCGHDERAWFVAAVPEDAGARDVQTAKDALKPRAVWDAMRAHGVRGRDRDRRRTKAFVRQGEWFFVPAPRLRVDARDVLRDEPIRRGGGKPHVCEQLYRSGGEQVFVHPAYPNGLTRAEYNRLPPVRRQWVGWTTMTRDARAYVRGAIRHPDHKTVRLDGWHELLMNTETQARAMAHVAFLD